MGIQEPHLRQLQLRHELWVSVQLAQHPWLLPNGLCRHHGGGAFQWYIARGPKVDGAVEMAG